MKKRSRAWPDELRKPVVLQDLAKLTPGLFGSREQNEQAFRETFAVEISRRMDVLAQFFSQPSFPTSEQGWRSLLWDLCEHWNIPAFQIVSSKPRGPGAKKIWTNEKHCELFGDVQSLVASSRMSEHAACKHIAKNPSRFGERYRRSKSTTESAWAKTLHRQYTEAKRRAKDDFTFRMLYFGEGAGLLRPIPEWPRLVQIAVERYAVTRI